MKSYRETDADWYVSTSWRYSRLYDPSCCSWIQIPTYLVFVFRRNLTSARPFFVDTMAPCWRGTISNFEALSPAPHVVCTHGGKARFPKLASHTTLYSHMPAYIPSFAWTKIHKMMQDCKHNAFKVKSCLDVKTAQLKPIISTTQALAS